MKAYHDLLEMVLNTGESHDNRTAIKSLSVFGAQFRHDMQTGFPLITTKKMPFRFIFEELKWFLLGRTDNQWLKERGVTIWDEWATAEQCSKYGRNEGDLGPIYGWNWRKFGLAYDMDETGCHDEVGFDQLAQLIFDIETNPNSRRLIVSAWHPYHAQIVELPPCHSFFQIKCHEDNTMSLHLYMRSADIFLGVPFNIASYGLLLKILCHVCGYTERDLIISFGDLHLYANHIAAAVTQLNRKEFKLPSVIINDNVNSEDIEKIKRIEQLSYEHVQLIGYNHHPAIKAEVAV